MSLAPGTDLGAYKIIAPLGAGGMGEVDRARDTRLGREVALKVMPLSRQDDGERRARFAREAQALAALNNPHIAADRRWELTIWDLKTARLVRAVALPLAVSAETQGMALAPDESHVIVGTGTATSDIWLLERFEPPALSWLSRLTRR